MIVCCAAAYLLAATPLGSFAIANAVANAAVAVGSVVVQRRSGAEPSRLITALGHITLALGGFLLFVWFSLPSGG